MGGSSEGQARFLLSLTGTCPPGEGESNSSALQLCYTRVKPGAEDLIPQGPG